MTTTFPTPATTTPPAPLDPQPPTRFLLSRLQREWRRVADRPESLVQARAWAVVPAGDLVTLDALLTLSGLSPRRVGPAPARMPDPTDPVGERANEVLRRLVLIAHDDDLAARVVLQRLLPGLSAVARRRSVHAAMHMDLLDELLSVAWGVIRRFPADRRPRHIAANLLRDCEYHAFRRGTRRKLVHELTEPHLLDAAAPAAASWSGAVGDESEPLAELLELVRTARRHHVTDDDVRLLAVLLTSASTAEAAARLRISERTVRNHRAALVHRLRCAAA